jgi:hypothetical protein
MSLPPEIQALIERFLRMHDESSKVVTLHMSLSAEEAAAVTKLLDEMRKKEKGV